MPDIFVDTDTKEPPVIQKPQEHAASPSPSPAPVHPDEHALQSVAQLMQSKNQSMGLLSAYARHPKGITFANQEPDEIILLFLRRHFITNIPWILATIALFFIPLIFLFLVSFLPSLPFPTGLTIVLTGFYYLIVVGYAFGKFISWFYNIGIVTQKRIIDLNSANILAHNTATANFNEIVDVKFIQRGFFQSTFDYGDIHIQTEALRANFDFDAAPRPTEVADIISDLRVANTMRGHTHGNS